MNPGLQLMRIGLTRVRVTRLPLFTRRRYVLLGAGSRQLSDCTGDTTQRAHMTSRVPGEAVEVQ